MAIFTNKADAKINMLVQLRQVDLSPYELTFIYRRVYEIWSGKAYRKREVEEFENEEILSKVISSVINVVDFFSMIQHGEISIQTLDWINTRHSPRRFKVIELSEEYYCEGATYKYLFTPDKDMPDDEISNRFKNHRGIVPIERLQVDYINYFEFDCVISEELKNLIECLVRISEQGGDIKTFFKNCIECENPFIPSRNTQRFCSTRCKHRKGQRERMKALYKDAPGTFDGRDQLL